MALARSPDSAVCTSSIPPAAKFRSRASPYRPHCQRAKNALRTDVQRANVSRYHLFFAKHCFASLSSVTGSPGNHLLTWKHRTLNFLSDLLCRVFSTHSFCFRFSNPVRKLPSAPALLDDLSAGESSSLTAPGAYSSFSSLFSYLSYLSGGIGSFVKDCFFPHYKVVNALHPFFTL